MLSARQRLEDAIIERLEGELGRSNPDGGYLRAVDPYNGELDDDDVVAEDIKRLLRGRAPAVLVSTTGSNYRSINLKKRRYDRELRVELLLVSNHRRSREAQTRADQVAQSDPTADPGIYAMLDGVFTHITGDCLGVDGVGPLMPQDDHALIRMADFTVWRVQYTAKELAIAPVRETQQRFTGHHIDTFGANADDTDVLATPPNPLVTSEGDEP